MMSEYSENISFLDWCKRRCRW